MGLLDELPRTRNEPHLIEHRLVNIVVILHHLRNRESRTRIVFKQLGGPGFRRLRLGRSDRVSQRGELYARTGRRTMLCSVTRLL